MDKINELIFFIFLLVKNIQEIDINNENKINPKINKITKNFSIKKKYIYKKSNELL
jgi:hypothetical protein